MEKSEINSLLKQKHDIIRELDKDNIDDFTKFEKEQKLERLEKQINYLNKNI